MKFHEILFDTDSESLFQKKFFQPVVNIKTKKLCLPTQFSEKVLKLTSLFLSMFRKWSATCTGRILERSFLLYACKCSISSFSSEKKVAKMLKVR